MLIFAAILFIAVSLSTIFHSHLCTGTDCPLCRLTDGKKLGMIYLIFAFFLLIPEVFYRCKAASFESLSRLTPVMERVKLNS